MNRRIVTLTFIAILAVACVMLAGTLDNNHRGQIPDPTNDSPDRLIAWLQGVRLTSAFSPAYHGMQLDNSVGEQLLELQVTDASVEGNTVEWVCESKYSSSVYIVACSDPGLDLGKCPIRVPPGGKVMFSTRLEEDGYAYIAVDTDEVDFSAADGALGQGRITVEASVGGVLAWDDRGHDYAQVRYFGAK